MVDIMVDRILHNVEVEKRWFNTTKDLIKVWGFKEIMDRFLDANYEVTNEYWNKNQNIPKSFFKGDLKITEIADQYEIKPFGKKLRLCPFHQDHNKSLSLSNEKGVFNCFGCGKKGNIITFYAELKKLKDDNKQG
jgi:hypothetical protein